MSFDMVFSSLACDDASVMWMNIKSTKKHNGP